MDKYIGKRLDGRYAIKELIGNGGMARVYKAYDSIEDRIVAVKILKDEFLDNQDFIRRFKNESKAIAVLSHPNIVKVFDVSFGDIIQYIVMEYIDGITLKEYINQQKVVSWQDVVYFTTQILNALQHAHSKGIIHRDVKPQNIILLKDGTIKVTDFGIARFSKYETHTMTDKAIGSVHYISPEQARGDVTDEKADIYSVGVMLYEMLTGKLPFEADNAVSVAIMQMQSNPVPLRKINDQVPEGLEEITLKAMQKEPENRYTSAVEMLSAIEEFKMNPSIKFQYKYFSDDGNTKYLDAINSSRNNDYGDDYKFIDEEEDNKPSKKKKMSKKKKIIIWSIVAAVIILLALGICAITGVFNGQVKDVDVPNLIGKKLNEVKTNPEYSKFNFDIEYSYDSKYTENTIIDQDPKSGTKKIKENATIHLKVNSKDVTLEIPRVKGLSKENAISKLSALGFITSVSYVDDSETAKNIVKGTSPEEGTKVKVSETIIVYVSKGPEATKIAVPDVAGYTLDAAKKELASKGLKVNSNVIYKNSDKPKDTVMEVSPLPGVEVTKGSQITLTVSSGSKVISVSFSMPSNLPGGNATMTVSIDGVQDASLTQTVTSNSQKTIDVTGTTGTKTLNIYLNNSLYKVISVNFDNSTVKEIQTYSSSSGN